MMRHSIAFTQGKCITRCSDQTAIHQSHGSYIYFWSRDGGGKSHLLHAACAELSLAGDAVGYVPLDKRAYFVPDVLEGMEHLSLVCIDNVQCIAGMKSGNLLCLICIIAY